MQPWQIAAAALGLGVGAVVVAGPPKKGLVKFFPEMMASSANLPKRGYTPTPIINPNIDLVSGKGHVELPSLEELGAVAAAATHQIQDSISGVEEASAGIVYGQPDPTEARAFLFRKLLKAIRTGLRRKATNDPLETILGANGGGHYAGPIIAWTLSYMASPALGDLRSRVSRMAQALEDLIAYPTLQDYAAEPLYDTTRLAAGMGISQATGDQNKKLASVALVDGPVGYTVWQASRQHDVDALIADWRAFFGDGSLSIETASTPQLMNLAVSLGVLYFEFAAQKTCTWPLGPPAKVDTWGSIKKAITGVWGAGVAAFSGNYAALLNVALTTADKAPLPAKVEAIMESAQNELASWA